MVYKIDRASEVQIAFMEDDGVTIKVSVKITHKDFKSRIIQGLRENIPGFALLDIDFPQFDFIPSLKLSSKKNSSIGASIAIIGHQKDYNNLALKTGTISSYSKQNGTKYIQFDAAVDKGNSGSPLIDAESGEVVGIVGHRLANIIDSHKNLMQIINNNLAMLKEAEGKIQLHDIDPIQVLIANQNQIKHLAQEMYKTSSFMYGFALNIDQVAEYFDIAELEKDNSSEFIHVYRQ